MTVKGSQVEPGGDTEAPTVPEKLEAKEVTSSTVTVKWSASKHNKGVAGYVIYVDGLEIGKVADTEAVIKNLKADTEYEISVRAYDEAGNLSESAVITVRTEKASGSGSEGSGNTGTTGSPTVEAVQTGDAAPIVIMIIVAGAAGAAVMAMMSLRAKAVRRARRRNRRTR